MRLRYDGSGYHGWQVQKNDITVAETLERVLSQICGHKVKVTGCGRTDAGVHAKNYCANFRTDSTIPPERLPLAVNSKLPDDISVLDAIYAPDEFNAVSSCIKKEYTYLICNRRIRDPFLRNRAYFYPLPLDVAVMQKAADAFVGTHDFAAVRAQGTNVKTTVRTVHYFDVSQKGDMIRLRVCADGFLYNMVRAMVGTVLYAAEGKISPNDISEILKSKNRCLAGPTMPPDGLYMTQLWYEGEVGEMMAREIL